MQKTAYMEKGKIFIQECLKKKILFQAAEEYCQLIQEEHFFSSPSWIHLSDDQLFLDKDASINEPNRFFPS